MKIQNFPFSSLPSSPISSTTTYTSPSLASSSIDSSSSSPPSTSSSPFSSPSSPPRCAGLDLLVKAIYQVTAGSIIGVPYIQKRVIRRRSRRSKNLSFDHTMFFNLDCKKDLNGIGGNDDTSALIKKQRKKKKNFKSKAQDSVVQTWRTKSRYGRDLSKLVIKL